MVALAGARVGDDLTPAELLVMSRARESAEWNHTVAIVCKLHNLWCKRRLDPMEVHPFAKKRSKGLSLGEFREKMLEVRAAEKRAEAGGDGKCRQAQGRSRQAKRTSR